MDKYYIENGYKFEICDWVKIPFKGNVVDGMVEFCRKHYDVKSNKMTNQYSVSIKGAKHFKKISENELLKYNPNGGVQKKYDPSTKKITIIHQKYMSGPKFSSCYISGDFNFSDFVNYLKSQYLDFEVAVL